ncbi:DUF1697 domain-containing protein [Flavobacterium sp. 3HN19-14]|uniref:DUF1697 domain-containing protein n=1 Tax=Flavobacterium sp. 3HN19-14 TaxID=3448133 RepID=UPI003EE0EB56
MHTYIALLRGINVSGHNMIKMELLRGFLKELDFANITTYINSGNILFQSQQTDTAKLEESIHLKIAEKFGFNIPVVIVTLEGLKIVVSNNPFSENEISDPTQPFVAFLSVNPSQDDIAAFSAIDFGKDKFHIIHKAIYLIYADGAAGKTKLTNALIENKLKVRATSRNWKTVHKLITLAEAYR